MNDKYCVGYKNKNTRTREITRSRKKHPDFILERIYPFPKSSRHRTVHDNELEEGEDKVVVVSNRKGGTAVSHNNI